MSLRLSRRWYRATWLLLVAACQSDAPVTTPPPPGPVAASIAVISGDAQHADPLDALAEPVRFQVRDSAGQVMAGVMVQFTATIGGGSVDVASSVTDSAGIAQMRWTMGELGGEQALQARVYRSEVVASASATTCNPSDCFPPKRLSSTLSDATLLNLATYEGSGQTVHPDVVRGHRGATGFWLAITPYPGGNSTYENPSIYHSRDAKTWIAPADVANPIARPDPGGYLSDPALVVDRDQHLWLYYRGVVQQQNIISVIHSTNGSKWDAPIAVVTVPSHQAVSPTVVRGAPGAPWQMWSVNAGSLGCSATTTTVERRISADGLNWGAPTTVKLMQPGQAIWHIAVHWIPARAEFWAIYNTYPLGTNCATNALYLARSPDGINWTVYPSPIARAGLIDAFKDLVYRSSFMVDGRGTKVMLWISGASYQLNVGYTWQTANVAIAVSDLLAIATAPAVALQNTPFRRDLPPPEPDVGPQDE